MDALRVLMAFSFGVGAAAFLTSVLRRILPRLGMVDAPRVDRWHQRQVPRPGGPAIVAAILGGVLLFVPRPWSEEMRGMLLGALFIFAVGLIDDFRNLPNPLKFTLLIVGSAVPLFFGVWFKILPALIGIPAAMLWILAITNAVNWLDNMDGLAAGVSAIAALTLAALSWGFRDVAGAATSALVGGACLGFLVFNFTPAKIFMGDSGSGFLGFMISTLAVLGTAQHVTNILLALIVPVMVLSIPIFDSAVVTVARLLNGRRIFQGGRDHPSHRLVVLGLSERRAVLYLYGLSVSSAAAALIATRLGVWTGLVFLVILGCLFYGLGVVVGRVRVYQDAIPANSSGVVLWQVMHKRRLVEITLDLLLLGVAYLGAYLLRFEGSVPPSMVQAVARSLPLVLAVKMGVFYLAGMYKGDWRYAGLLDLLLLARAATVGSLAVLGSLFIWTRLEGFSRAAIVIDWILTIGLLASIRLSVRLLQEYFASQRTKGKRVLIAGAGQGGILLLQELRTNPSLVYHPVGFVDDDPVKNRAVIRGLPVLGNCRDIPMLVKRQAIEEVLIAAPSMPRQERERIMLICSEAGVPCRVIRPLLEPASD